MDPRCSCRPFASLAQIDPRWLSTLDAIENALAEDALVYRYRPHQTSDGIDGEEGSFTCSSFWFVECLARAGQVEKARQHFENLLAHANHLGLFSEEIGRDGHQLGNFHKRSTTLHLLVRPSISTVHSPAARTLGLIR